MTRGHSPIHRISCAFTSAPAACFKTMDAIAFLATDVTVISEDAGFNKKRNRADGGSVRWLHFEGRPAFVAKSRFELPPKILCPKDFDVSTSLAPLFPRVAPGPKVRSTQVSKEKI